MSPIASWGRASFAAMGGFCRRRDYGGDDTDADQRDDVVEGELAPPATMIGHETAAIEEPEPAVVEADRACSTAAGARVRRRPLRA